MDAQWPVGTRDATMGLAEDSPKALLKNKFPFSHSIFRPSSPAPQSQNPQNISNIPTVLLNRRDQIWPKSGREKCEFIFEQRLNDCFIPSAISLFVG